MGEIGISVCNVSKCFKQYDRPIDRLKELIFPGQSRAKEFWALGNINLDVDRGHTLGIVGRNGSGKSTLLQIIVGTLTPSAGQVAVRGRISALLELGSGFNPEFTGRQNVFFNGQLLGLTQKELEYKFDSIAAFADIGDFIDRPVKTYSSGMFMRLAFAVATSVEPDILVVDEALSVGDEAFQRKCFARIESIRERNGIILFVSHSNSHIIQLCDEAVLLDRGELLVRDNPKFVLDQYHKLIYAPDEKAPALREEIRQLHAENVSGDFNSSNSDHSSSKPTKLNGRSQKPNESEFREFYDPELVPSETVSYISRGAKIIDPQITTIDGAVVNNLVGRREYLYTYTVEFAKSSQRIQFGMLIKTISGLELGGASYSVSHHEVHHVESGDTLTLTFRFKCLLNPGVYFLNAGVSGMVDGKFTFLARYIDVAMFRVLENDRACTNGTIDFEIEPSLRWNDDAIDRPRLIS